MTPLMPVLLQSQVTQVTASPPPSLASIAVAVSVFVGLCTIGGVLYRMGGHAQDLKNTKENLGKEMQSLQKKVTDGFESVERRFDQTDKRESENSERRNEWSRWRERTDGRLATTEANLGKLDKNVQDAGVAAQAAISRQEVIDQRLKPIEDVVKLRNRGGGDDQ